ECGAAHGKGPVELRDPAALADTDEVDARAAAAATATAGDGPVVDEATVLDGEGRDIAVDRAALGDADEALSVGDDAAVTADSSVARKGAAADGEGRPQIEDAAAPDGTAVAANNLVSNEAAIGDNERGAATICDGAAATLVVAVHRLVVGHDIVAEGQHAALIHNRTTPGGFV